MRYETLTSLDGIIRNWIEDISTVAQGSISDCKIISVSTIAVILVSCNVCAGAVLCDI